MPSSPDPPSSNSPAFIDALAEVERSLQTLKERHAQVERDRQRKEELGNRYEDIRRIPKSDRTPELQTELDRLTEQIEELRLALESELFSLSSLREPFWLAVRFGGAGVVLGWLLKTWAG